jgi:hypothetical protein
MFLYELGLGKRGKRGCGNTHCFEIYRSMSIGTLAFRSESQHLEFHSTP